MKKALIIGILYFSSFCYSQTESRKTVNDTLIWTETTCEKGTEKANEDFEKGIYNKYFYGLMAEITPKAEEGFSDFYKEYVRKKYLINIESKGCIVSDYSECYTDVMDKLILVKFGKDVFKNARKEALKLFAQRQK